MRHRVVILSTVVAIVTLCGWGAARITLAGQANAYASPWPASDLERRLPRQLSGSSLMIDSIDFSKVPASQNIGQIFASAATLGPWLQQQGRSWKDVRYATAMGDMSKPQSAAVTLYQVIGAPSDALLGYFRSLTWFRNSTTERLTIAGRTVERSIDVGGGSAMYAWVDGDVLYLVPHVAPADFGARVVAALTELSDAEKTRAR